MIALTRLLVRKIGLPVIAAGGIIDGAGVAAALDLGAAAAQLGTAFVACPEAAADEAYRAALTGAGAYHTVLTSLISGRPARALANRFTALSELVGARLPPGYPVAMMRERLCTRLPRPKANMGSGHNGLGRAHP
jgi:nitronate monooxygenase